MREESEALEMVRPKQLVESVSMATAVWMVVDGRMVTISWTVVVVVVSVEEEREVAVTYCVDVTDVVEVLTERQLQARAMLVDE